MPSGRNPLHHKTLYLEVAATETVAERGQRLELDTALAGPPGDPASHYAMGFARVLCSAIFVSGLEADFAIKNVGFFTSPPETRGDIGDTLSTKRP